jgi:hypothetical protein
VHAVSWRSSAQRVFNQLECCEATVAAIRSVGQARQAPHSVPTVASYTRTFSQQPKAFRFDAGVSPVNCSQSASTATCNGLPIGHDTCCKSRGKRRTIISHPLNGFCPPAVRQAWLA